MKIILSRFIFFGLCFLISSLVCTPLFARNGRIEKVTVTTSTVIIDGTIDGKGFPDQLKVRIYAYEYWEDEHKLKDNNIIVNTDNFINGGRDTGFSFVVDRYGQGGIDRLFSIYVLAIYKGKGFRVYGKSRYPDDIDGISKWDYPILVHDSFKGLSCIVDQNDAVSLGIAHGNMNAFINHSWFKNSKGADTIVFEMDGNEYYFCKSKIEYYEKHLKFYADKDITITLILCIENNDEYPPEFSWLKPILKHPDCVKKDDVNMIAWYSAPNMKTKQGVNYFRALHELLAQRWMRPDKLYGRIEGITVSNEVNSHWFWCNMGEKTEQEYMHDYERAMRITYYAQRKYYKHAKTFISLEHNWNKRHIDWPLKYQRGKDFIDILAKSSRENGDFDWGINFHPYPEDLSSPTVWKNGMWTVMDYNTEKITGKNLEVLNSYMEREDIGGYLYRGNKLRSIVFGEHGSNCLDNGVQQYLDEQAAGYCYYYWKMLFSGAFESWCFHRHQDHPDEGGLNLGLIDQARNRKQPIYNVFRDIDDDPEAVTAFAKPIIGIREWKDIMYNDTRVTEPEIIEVQDGKVTVRTTIDDVYGDKIKVRVDYSVDSGRSFIDGDAYIDESFGIKAERGKPVIDNDKYFQVRGIQTSRGVNTITFMWDTESVLNGMGRLEDVNGSALVVRIRASNGTFSGIPGRSAVFSIDDSNAANPEQ